MRVFFIRHAETVDNVAGIYAGITDSELTNHGLNQTRQLGTWMKENRPPVGKIFSSPLQRTRRTAGAILSAQQDANTGDAPLTLTLSPLLIEQDFGFYEKKPFSAFAADATRTRRVAHAEQHRDDPGFKDVESATSMAARGDEFLDTFLLPVIQQDSSVEAKSLVIVSHGIMLSHLWRRFLLRLPRKSITIAPEVTAAKGQIILEHPGGWTNTGILEIEITPSKEQGNTRERDDIDARPTVPLLTGFDVLIISINGVDHLKGIKRARGGIGSAKYDESQKSLDTFFKRAKKA